METDKPKRSEDDKLVQAPIKVILGGEEYEVKLLVIREARAWRQKVVELISVLPGRLNATSDKPDEFRDAMSALLVTMPDAVADLFFSYAKDLDRGEIENIANESELARAFDQLMEIAFPLSGSLVGAMARTGRR